jgi:hypothetical protein
MELIQQFLKRLRSCFHRLEAVSGRIQIEHHLIGSIEVVHPTEPDVRRHACLIGQIHQRGGIIADDVLDAASHLLNGHRLYPGGIIEWRSLLEKAGFIDPVRVAFHGQRPAPEMRQDPGGDAAVVIDQILVREAVLWKQDLPRMGDLYFMAADLDRFSLNSHRQPSRMISSGLLSSQYRSGTCRMS